MKNLYTKNEFLNYRDEEINEGFNIFKGLWNSAMKAANKIKGSKEITQIHDKYKGLIDETFNKMQNVESVRTASAKKENYEFLIEADVAAPEQPATAAKPAPAKEGDVNNLANLKPDQIKNLSKQTIARVDELKKQFDTDVNNVIAKLSKNPNYSSDKLKQFAVVMKNQLTNYIYDKWYNFYTQIGDQNKILEITKVKKENEVVYKKSIQDLNTKISEKQQELQVQKGSKYKYYSETNKGNINVQVVGSELGKDENGKPDVDKDHNNMWKVKTDKGTTFWIAPSSFKQTTKPENKTKAEVPEKQAEVPEKKQTEAPVQNTEKIAQK